MTPPDPVSITLDRDSAAGRRAELLARELVASLRAQEHYWSDLGRVSGEAAADPALLVHVLDHLVSISLGSIEALEEALNGPVVFGADAGWRRSRMGLVETGEG